MELIIDRNCFTSGTTGSSFNWINATYPKNPYVYNYLWKTRYHSFQKKVEKELDFHYRMEWILRMDKFY